MHNLDNSKRPNLDDYFSAGQLINWAMRNMQIPEGHRGITEEDIREIMRWIGFNAIDTMYPDDVPKLGRIGIGLMLTVTLLAFPAYYVKHKLSQFN